MFSNLFSEAGRKGNGDMTIRWVDKKNTKILRKMGPGPSVPWVARTSDSDFYCCNEIRALFCKAKGKFSLSLSPGVISVLGEKNKNSIFNKKK